MTAELTPEQREQIAHACDAAIDFGQTWIRFLRNGDETMLLPTVAAMLAAAKAEALREFADTRGVNIGDEDSEWWQGYRQAQRECLHDAVDRANQIEGQR